jgi:hypothetical protein
LLINPKPSMDCNGPPRHSKSWPRGSRSAKRVCIPAFSSIIPERPKPAIGAGVFGEWKRINAFQPQPKQPSVQPNVATPTNAQLPATLKLALLIVAGSFLAYSIYWLINGVIWGYTVAQMLLHIYQIPILTSMGAPALTALFIQEICSVANSFVLLFCGVFAFQSAIFYVRKIQKYFQRLRWALVLLAVFSLLLVPASVHHLLGVAFGWVMVDVFVGLSYLLQALLIVPPLFILSQKMRKPQEAAPILKWATIAAPLFVFALWFKYLFLWVDTLSPMGPKEASAWSLVGAANSVVTLLVASAVTAIACYTFNWKKKFSKPLAGIALSLVGGFFIIDLVVAFFVPIYASFWYLTDFWMLTLPVLGGALLMSQTKTVNHTNTPSQKHA